MVNKALSGGGQQNNELEYEMVKYNLPANASSCTIPLTKGKIPKIIMGYRSGYAYGNINASNGNVMPTTCYNYAGNLSFSLTLSSSSIKITGMNTSSTANAMMFMVFYE